MKPVQCKPEYTVNFPNKLKLSLAKVTHPICRKYFLYRISKTSLTNSHIRETNSSFT